MGKEMREKWEIEFDNTFKVYNNSYKKLGYFRCGKIYTSYPDHFDVRKIKDFIRKNILRKRLK